MFDNNKESLYIKIINEYKYYIESGVYRNGDRLPSVRSLASEYGINPNTVQRAYQILEKENYITTITKKGVYVSYQEGDYQKVLLEHTKEQIDNIKKSKVSKEQLLEIIEEVYHDQN